MFMSKGRKRKEDSVGYGMVVENKTSESGKSQCETSSVGNGEVNEQEKESTLKRDEVGSLLIPWSLEVMLRKQQRVWKQGMRTRRRKKGHQKAMRWALLLIPWILEVMVRRQVY